MTANKAYKKTKNELKEIYKALKKKDDISGDQGLKEKISTMYVMYKTLNYNKFKEPDKECQTDSSVRTHISLKTFKAAVCNTYICLTNRNLQDFPLSCIGEGEDEKYPYLYVVDNECAKSAKRLIIPQQQLGECNYYDAHIDEKEKIIENNKPLIISALVMVLLCIIGFCITIGIVSGNINEAYVSKIKNDGNFEFTFEEEKVDNETCVVITGLNEEGNPKLYEDFSGEVIIPEKIDGKKVIGVAKGAFSCENKHNNDECKSKYSKITNIIIPDSLEFIAKDAFACCNLESFGEEYEGMTFVGLPSLNTVGAHNGYYDKGNKIFNIWLVEVTQSEDEINIDRSYYFDDAVGHKNWEGELKGIAYGALGQYDTAVSIPDDVKIVDYKVEFINVEIPGSENGCCKEIKNLDYTWSGSEYPFNNVEDKISLNEPNNVEELSSFYNFAGYYIKENKSTENDSDCIKKDQLKEIDVNKPIYAANFFDKKFTNMTIYAAWTPKDAYSIFDFEIIEKTDQSKDYYAKINGLKDKSIQKINIPDEVKEISQGAFSGCSSLIIYAEAASKPEGWVDGWNTDIRYVIWGYGTDNEKVELDGFLWKFSNEQAANKQATLIKYSGTSKAVVVEKNIEFQGKSYTVSEIAEDAFAEDQGIAVFTPLGKGSLIFGKIPVVWNYAGTKSDSGLKWGLNTAGEVVIVGHYGYDKDKCIAQVFIPSRITVDDNTTVTEDNIFIAPYAFKNYKISKILIDQNFCADNIPGSAFLESNITNAKIPTSAISKLPKNTLQCVEITSGGSIPEDAFSDCSNLTSITLPAGITKIGTSAFSGCSNLTSITLPAGITEIGTSAFSGCSNLTSITLPAGITEIGTSAFSGCSNLTSITIPASVKKIGAFAFSNCTNLEKVYLECQEGWKAVNGTKVQKFVHLKSDTAADYLTNNYREYTWEREEEN